MKPPEWGPAAVAAVPAKIVSAPSGISPRTDHTPTRSVDLGRDPGSYVAPPRQRECRHQDQQRETEVRHHEAWRQMVEHREPAEHRLGQHAERQQQREPARSRRNGRRVNASTAATTVITPDDADTARLPNSISACELSGGSGVPPHFGQFAQPSPESVSRTAAPVNTISVSDASVA